jgi:predicted 2-oxoglutarate/Fe(II)-dependent dioxygenase YbiX
MMMVISRLKSGERKEKHQLVKQMENECHAFMGADIKIACQQPTFYKFHPQDYYPSSPHNIMSLHNHTTFITPHFELFTY